MLITYEQAAEVSRKVSQMERFQYPAVNAVGITKSFSSEGEEWAVSVNFVGPKPEQDIPDRVDGVKIEYRFDVGEIVAYGTDNEETLYELVNDDGERVSNTRYWVNEDLNAAITAEIDREIIESLRKAADKSKNSKECD